MASNISEQEEKKKKQGHICVVNMSDNIPNTTAASIITQLHFVQKNPVTQTAKMILL